jgi:LacI family transcriptional regulator
MKNDRRPITIHDVAKAAGVSVTTISRVLNNKDDVASETSERVKRVIQELGYASSLAARGMRSHRTKVIGLITPEVTSAYSIAVLQGINWALTPLDYDMVIYSNMSYRRNVLAPQETYFVSLLNGNIADGVIVVTPVTTSFSVNTAPIVVVDPNNEFPDYPAIIATHWEGACEAMQYLIGLGHRRIGFITGRHELVSSARRLQAYRDSLTAAGIPIDEALIETGDYTSETAAACTHRLLALDTPPTAIFAANDQMAMGVYRVAREKGIRIPEDLSVVGFDNLRESALLTPPLTTVDQFLFNMGHIAVEMLMKLINGESLDVHLHKVNTQLVIRNSCCSPAPQV